MEEAVGSTLTRYEEVFFYDYYCGSVLTEASRSSFISLLAIWRLPLGQGGAGGLHLTLKWLYDYK